MVSIVCNFMPMLVHSSMCSKDEGSVSSPRVMFHTHRVSSVSTIAAPPALALSGAKEIFITQMNEWMNSMDSGVTRTYILIICSTADVKP